MTATVDNAVVDLQHANAELQQLLEERTRLLDECRAELAARNSEYGERTIHVLKVMSASPSDPQPVFDLIVTHAAV
jgi:hypothetical protein